MSRTPTITKGTLPDTMEVYALTPMMYVAYSVDGDLRTPLADQQGTIVFPSRFAALDTLQTAGVREITFIHQSAYDEMVGLEGTANATDFRETVRYPTG